MCLLVPLIFLSLPEVFNIIYGLVYSLRCIGRLDSSYVFTCSPNFFVSARSIQYNIWLSVFVAMYRTLRFLLCVV